ncbi:Asp-tRNA(Asn)/Glu-tRNA(Gln) amidotransferase subunit GatC [Ethanoligenens harbinense]|uniref:Aspartyl/glutamyl-tRNA(Asn/Gln) amidotransferase subunit C n=1 Tax=Ethanoligenens harbinense (strain DSM 18485 / JCM 12961 / CGMCC 1.5033 / YUAN-3) TaxID=663278 RepID=E6U4M6_ETHHY|nr:Asp-tRNA(Asn)/Glu-tRNA(Gln) amidotransferase subunit GatC [Ethanoligenens harbinense]ADU26654.1 glutamyl-tRNA(Gln) amidotransferase, C subunit [Ethanoligenens harbinense YUAN-3]AVQ95773.1 Asp-tRNA(Asn)/Glu-tRNA(Gln) amidotransferase GatCAB subunit C [Ethanoligenens harbinense YUAN-3]AYF38435.1 Asp-tRNA(Asn)/Glu-tRNA(Gln) amidotransferase GatCAB subunit C [Ethanoligenens harbinense]AYF41180.1 Asp-tRNA(Asn)/Glu-tRNA(Gln) amidotransferase GatCAB subunit C [Ethanoligenens harbinense]QCN92012.1 
MDQKPDIERIARLAQIELSDEEKAVLEHDLTAVIGYMDVLSKIDTTGVEPMEHVLGLSNVLRTDKPVPSYDRARLLGCAPKTEDGYYDVPLAVEQE